MRGFVFSMCSLIAAAFVGCAKDVIEPSINVEQAQVKVIPTFHSPSKRGTTRAVDGLDINSTGFSCLYDATASDAQSPDSKAKVMVDDGSSNYNAYAYRVTGSSALTVEGDAPLFPLDVNAVNVYGWYPYTADNTFSIQADQRTTTGYCLSDLMFANKVQCTRDANGVTPAPLTFRHAMSKVKIVLNPTAHVTVTDVKLMNVKPTVTIDDTDKDNLEVSEASGLASDVILLSGGSITSASAAADKTLAAVFPAQTIDAAFIQITAEIGGTPSTITYDLSGSAKTFEKGNEYTADITVSATETGDPAIDISDWGNQGETGYFGDPGVALADATVGMIIAENGKAYTPADYRLSFGKKVAIVAYKGNGEANTSFNNGLAIALSGIPLTKVKDSSNHLYDCTYNTGWFSDLNGIEYTNRLKNSTYTKLFYDYLPAKMVVEYRYDKSVSAGAHPANTSQWFIPTIGQWNLIVKGLCGDHGDLSEIENDNYKCDKFNELIIAAGGNATMERYYFMSIGPDSNTPVWVVHFEDGRLYTYNQAGYYTARAILAF